MAMCRGAESNQAPWVRHDVMSSPEESPRLPVTRPSAPAPGQTNHWLQDLDAEAMDWVQPPVAADQACPPQPPHPQQGQQQQQLLQPPSAPAAARSPSPDDGAQASDAIERPRSPTPTKMLAWEEEQNEAGSGHESDREERGDQMDGLIGRLIAACQQNNVVKAFKFYDKLCKMRVPLYEGVYKMIIECCMRTQQLGHAMQFYETLKSSGQRVSSRLITVLIEALAQEQHGDKVHAVWQDWCPAGQVVGASQAEVLLVVVSALIRTMSPDLAQEVLGEAARKSGASFLFCLPDAEVQLEELLHLNEVVAEEARMNGTLMGALAGQFSELHAVLEELRHQCLQEAAENCRGFLRGDAEELLMEDLDVDLDLDMAAR